MTGNHFDLHYYLDDGSHLVDARVRNRCESELLAIISEISALLEISPEILALAASEGGFRDIWKVIRSEAAPIGVVLLAVQIVLTTAPMIHQSDKERLEEELLRLQIKEAKQNLTKAAQSAKEGKIDQSAIRGAASALSGNLRVVKRRSNFYAEASKSMKIEKLGFLTLDQSLRPVVPELTVPRRDFSRFILHSDSLPALEIEADVEIVSPVLKEGRYKWKGIYDEQPISFEMLDPEFKQRVLDGLEFKRGAHIRCVLRITRELNEIGDIHIKGYAVTAVIQKLDDPNEGITRKGLEYYQAKKFIEGQRDLLE